MSIAFQILLPGINFDLSHAGKGPSDGWFLLQLLQQRAGPHPAGGERLQNDKDFIAAP
jgi:nitrous-oxide reductase